MRLKCGMHTNGIGYVVGGGGNEVWDGPRLRGDVKETQAAIKRCKM